MAANTAAVTKKQLASAIIDFLNTSLTDGTLPTEDRESIEVATSCIADSFKIDPSDGSLNQGAAKSGKDLFSIYSSYQKLDGSSIKSADGADVNNKPNSNSPSSSEPLPNKSASEGGRNEEAEKLKGEGNVAMQQKNYSSAIDFYTRAISISPSNPIYLSNRAAAYSATQQHEKAKDDAELAVAADPSYTKAWSRLGLAKYALGDVRGSMDAYKRGIDAEGNGGSDAMKKGYETAKRKVEEAEIAGGATGDRARSPGSGGNANGMPDLASLAGMFGGGGGGGGGMPDFSQLMNNPMMRQMAERVMQNPEMMEGLMNNPQLRNLANQYGGGRGAGGAGAGGMPDMASLMQDPNIAEMARNFMGGGGPGEGGRGTGPGN